MDKDEDKHLTACPECDLLIHETELQPRQKAKCPRCATTLRLAISDSIDKTIALSLTGLLLYLPAMSMPVMTISVAGMEGKSSVFGSVAAMKETGYPIVGALVFLVGVLFPLIKLGSLFWVALSLRCNYRPRYLSSIFRGYGKLAEWGMAEVYMLAVLVSIIKMHSMGTLEFNLGFFCFSALCLVTVAASSVVDEHLFWQRIRPRQNIKASSVDVEPGQEVSARACGLMQCLDCGQLMRHAETMDDEIIRCPRCSGHVHSRKPRSISTTWALVVCALILFLPANILPIMRVDFLGSPEITTIMDGIIYFFQEGEFFVGGIIFLASVLVPLFKIVGMIIILLSIRFRWVGWLRHKARMFRFVEFIGRWSFLDVFVIALLMAMIQFGTLTNIAAHPAIRYFTAVVIVTMSAAIAFDPRILWDTCAQTTEKEKRQHG